MEELDLPDWETKIKFGKSDDMNNSSKEEERKNNLKNIFKDSSNLENFNSDTTMKFL